MSKLQVIFTSILFFLVTSCSTQKDMNTATYAVTRGDFKNILLLDGVTEPVNATTIICPGYVDGVIEWLIEDGTYVEEGEIVCKIEFQELQTNYDQLAASLETSAAKLTKQSADLKMQYALLEAQVKSNEAQNKISQLDSLELLYASPTEKRIRELELKQIAIERAKYESKLKTLEIIQQSEIKKLELETQQFANQVKAVKDQLDGLIIKAPKKGLAIRSKHFFTGNKIIVGDPVWGNIPILYIPEFAEMKVKINASESDYKLINIGDSISYTFDAMPDNIGFGKIIKKAPIGQPYKQDSKVKFFEIEASIDSVTNMPEPGFTANCHIILQEVKDTITIPQVAIFDQDSIKVVYVKTKKGYQTRQISTGISSPRESIVRAGLAPGEIIALIKPKDALIKTKALLPKQETTSPADSTANDTIPPADPIEKITIQTK